MNEYHPHIESVVEGIVSSAIDKELDVDIQATFPDDINKRDLSCIMFRPDIDRIGLISVEVKEYPDDDIVFFKFKPKLYRYAKMEGFTGEQMFNDISVFEKVTKEQYFDYILECDD